MDINYFQDIKLWVNIVVLILGIVVIPICGYIWLKKLLYDNRNIHHAKIETGGLLLPPEDLGPCLSGYLLNLPGIGRSIAATLFDMANRGIIRFEQNITAGHGTPPIVFMIKNEAKCPFEQLIIDEYSSPEGRELRFGFHDTWIREKFRNLSEQEVFNSGYFLKKPSTYLGYYYILILLGLEILPLVGLFVWYMNKQYTEFGWIPCISMMIVGVFAFILGGKYIKLTEKGLQESIKWVIFYKRLRNILSGNNLSNNELNQWNSYLPYAASLKDIRRWLKVFANNNIPVPDWYKPIIISTEKKRNNTSLLNQDINAKYFIRFVEYTFGSFLESTDR